MSLHAKNLNLPGVGVFGAGNIARVMIPCLRDKGFKVEAIWASTKEAAEQIAKELDIPFYTEKVDQVLLRKGVDLVCIICPPHFHSEIAVKALGIGKHVLCDRPAGLCQAEVKKMVNAAQYYPALISIIFHTLRFLPAFIQMKKVIQDGYIGDITICDAYVKCGSLLPDKYDWMSEGLMGGGILSNIGSHIIDIIYYVTNKKVLRTHGILKTYTKTTDTIKGIRHITSDDFCTFQLEMEGGICTTVTLNQHLPGQFSQEVMICGTKGHVSVRGGDLYGQKNNALFEEVLYLDVEDMKHTMSTFPIKNSTSEHFPSILSSMPKPYMKGLIKMVNALKEAFTCSSWVKEPVAMAASFEDGQYIQGVIDAIKESSKMHEWVSIDKHPSAMI